MWTRLVLAFSVLLTISCDDSLSGYHIIQTSVISSLTQIQVIEKLVELHERDGKIKLLEDQVFQNVSSDLIVAPEYVSELREMLLSFGLSTLVVDDDLGRSIEQGMQENERSQQDYFRAKTLFGQQMTLEMEHSFYRSYQGMIDFMRQRETNYPEVKVFDIGKSYEGRTVYGMQIDSTDSPSTKPSIWIDAGIHAREWIAPATALYIADKLLTDTSDQRVAFMRQNYNVVILPEVNPDGYEYSRQGGWKRLWRKNMRPVGNGCIGTDGNRNFAFDWGYEGTSKSPCSDTYGGPSAFSEPETRNIRDAVLERKNDIKLFISLHSFTQLVLVPWAGRRSKPVDYSQLIYVGQKMGEAIEEVNGLYFKVGTAPDILYAGSGGSFDWAKETAGIKYAYTPELRPSSIWDGGFEIPARGNAVASGEEIFAGIHAAAKEIV